MKRTTYWSNDIHSTGNTGPFDRWWSIFIIQMMGVVFNILFLFNLILRRWCSKEFHFWWNCQMIGRHGWNGSAVVWSRFSGSGSTRTRASGNSCRSRICWSHCWTRSHSRKTTTKIRGNISLLESDAISVWLGQMWVESNSQFCQTLTKAVSWRVNALNLRIPYNICIFG